MSFLFHAIKPEITFTHDDMMRIIRIQHASMIKFYARFGACKRYPERTLMWFCSQDSHPE